MVPGAARIAVDLLGGDHAPAVVVDGALRAVQADPALHLLLVGPVEAAGAVLAALAPADRARVRAITAPADRADLARVTPRAEGARLDADQPSKPPAPPPPRPSDASPDPAARRPSEASRRPGASPDPATTAGERPTRVAESWVESGVRAAVLAVAQGHADAAVSAGNTGATVTSAALGLGRWPDVRRPALAAVLPTVAGRLILLDVGSSVDPDEQTLAMHARLGAGYARIGHDVAAPRVGLLTIGTERGKGDRLRRAAPAVLAATTLPAGRYVGLVEGNDVVTGATADVVVTDGFTGNILLKGLETAYARVGSPNAETPPRAAVLLGVSGTVVVCHGAADAADLADGIALAATLHRRGAVPAIAALMADNEVTG
ncbi:MAG TPA: phosphate acyltransferase PlsX [Actinoplanes sp.]|nr:phosphate acyltransferase PlsX [Actinoplanes sp.]